MVKTKSIYQTLNKREKYILKVLNIEKDELIPTRYFSICNTIKKNTKLISKLPLTREQVAAAIMNYHEPKDELFKGIYFITSDKDYPDATINMYKILSKENRRTIKILGILIENKEISSKEYLKIGNILCNKLLLKFGTGVNPRECYKLQKKIGKILLERLKAESSLD